LSWGGLGRRDLFTLESEAVAGLSNTEMRQGRRGLIEKAFVLPHPFRKIPRSVHEAARDKARAIAKTEAYAVSCRERKRVEMLFAHLKRILRLDRLRLRGSSGAKDEFLLAATAQNLRKLAKLFPIPTPIFAT
jgi:hypothetical protein